MLYLIFGHIFTVHVQNQQFSSIQLWIQWSQFPVRVQNFDDRKAFTAIFGHVSLCICRSGIISTSSLKSVVTVILSDTLIFYRSNKFLAIWQHIAWFLLCMHRNGNFRVLAYNSDNVIGLSMWVEYFGNCNMFSFFGSVYPEVCHISISGLLDQNS